MNVYSFISYYYYFVTNTKTENILYDISIVGSIMDFQCLLDKYFLMKFFLLSNIDFKEILTNSC